MTNDKQTEVHVPYGVQKKNKVPQQWLLGTWREVDEEGQWLRKLGLQSIHPSVGRGGRGCRVPAHQEAKGEVCSVVWSSAYLVIWRCVAHDFLDTKVKKRNQKQKFVIVSQLKILLKAMGKLVKTYPSAQDKYGPQEGSLYRVTIVTVS